MSGSYRVIIDKTDIIAALSHRYRKVSRAGSSDIRTELDSLSDHKLVQLYENEILFGTDVETAFSSSGYFRTALAEQMDITSRYCCFLCGALKQTHSKARDHAKKNHADFVYEFPEFEQDIMRSIFIKGNKKQEKKELTIFNTLYEPRCPVFKEI